MFLICRSIDNTRNIADKMTLEKIDVLQKSISKLKTSISPSPKIIPSSMPKKSSMDLKPLEYCTLPKIGERFDVKVITSSNPSNFVVSFFKQFLRDLDFCYSLELSSKNK